MAVAGLFGDRNTFSRNSQFGKFNSHSGRRKFPVGATTGIWSQGLDSVLPILLQWRLGGGKSMNFPVHREEAGTTG
jgi:hypothetical protein